METKGSFVDNPDRRKLFHSEFQGIVRFVGFYRDMKAFAEVEGRVPRLFQVNRALALQRKLILNGQAQ